MVLTEAFAAGTPVVASDIAGYRDVVRDGIDGVLTPRGDAQALAETLRRLALEPRRRADDGAGGARARRALRVAARRGRGARGLRAGARRGPRPTRLARAAVHHGLRAGGPAPAGAGPGGCRAWSRSRAVPPARRALRVARRAALAAVSLAALALALLALQRIGVGPVLASLVASSPA